MEDEEDFKDLGFDVAELENPIYNQPIINPSFLPQGFNNEGFGLPNTSLHTTLEASRLASLRDNADINSKIYRLQARQIELQMLINDNLEPRLREGREHIRQGATPFYTTLVRQLETTLNNKRQELQQVINEIKTLFDSKLDLNESFTNMDSPYRNPYNRNAFRR